MFYAEKVDDTPHAIKDRMRANYGGTAMVNHHFHHPKNHPM
jgi:hypothetical protein